MILLDTNLLVRMTRSQDPQSSLARAAVQSLLRRNERLIVVPQNLYEFWAVATRLPGPRPAGLNDSGGREGRDGAHCWRYGQGEIGSPDRKEVEGRGAFRV